MTKAGQSRTRSRTGRGQVPPTPAPPNRGGRTDPDVLAKIENLATDNRATAAGIARAMRREYGEDAPSEVTVRAIVRRVRRQPVSEPWSMVSATPDEAAHVLPVLAELLRSSEWRERTLTRLEAEWIVKLRTAVPDLPIAHALRYTRRYLATLETGEPTGRLDRELAAGGWRGLEAAIAAYYGEGDMYASKERRND